VATEHFGYRATKTADVAAQAGMSTGSLFTYVESKEGLFIWSSFTGSRCPRTASRSCRWRLPARVRLSQ
jgi:hypothetical protein